MEYKLSACDQQKQCIRAQYHQNSRRWRIYTAEQPEKAERNQGIQSSESKRRNAEDVENQLQLRLRRHQENRRHDKWKRNMFNMRPIAQRPRQVSYYPQDAFKQWLT